MLRHTVPESRDWNTEGRFPPSGIPASKETQAHAIHSSTGTDTRRVRPSFHPGARKPLTHRPLHIASAKPSCIHQRYHSREREEKRDLSHSHGSSWIRRGGRALTPAPPPLLLTAVAQAPNSALLVAIQQPALWERQEGTNLWYVLIATFPVEK